MNEELYLVAYKDIEQKEIDEALWLKAMSHAVAIKLKPSGPTLNYESINCCGTLLFGTAPTRRSASQLISQELI